MCEMSLPEHWKVVRLGDVCNIIMGQSPPSTAYNDEGLGMPFLQGKAEFTELSPIPTKYCTTQLKIAPKGSVLMSVRAPVGDVNLADRKYIIGRGLTSLGLKRGNNRFLFYLLLHNKKEIEAKGYGSTFKSINKAAVNDFQVALPPLPEQHAIAHVLQTIQEAKAARQRELALERERKAALMNYLLSYGTKGEPRKETEIGGIPESWEVVRLGEVLENTQYGLSAKANLERQGYPLLRMNNLVDGLVDTSDLKHIQLDREELEKFKLNKGDVLFNRTNSFELVGKTGLFDKEGDYVFASYLIRLATDVQRLNSYFLSFYFNWEVIQTELKRLSFRGAGQSNISASKLKMLKIRLPSLLEQRQIAQVLCAFDDRIAALEGEAARLDELFHAMLDELMTGKRSAVSLIDAELPN